MTVRRLKTYTGSQGYVYQYYFVGKRPTPDATATEYIFDVTSDRKTTYAVSIILSCAAVADWAETHGRSLADPEQYAAVKMTLFRAFDEVEHMQHEGSRLELDFGGLEEQLAALGIE